MDEAEPSEQAKALRLKDGEWQMFCIDCGYKADKNTAQSPLCPQCGNRLHLAREGDRSKS